MSLVFSPSQLTNEAVLIQKASLNQIVYPHLGWGLTSHLMPSLSTYLSEPNHKRVLWIQANSTPSWHAPFFKAYPKCQERILFCTTVSDKETFSVLLQATASECFDYIFYTKNQSIWGAMQGRKLYYFARKYQVGLVELVAKSSYATQTSLTSCVVQVEAKRWNFIKIKNQNPKHLIWRNPYELFLSQFSKRDPFLPLRLFLHHHTPAVLP